MYYRHEMPVPAGSWPHTLPSPTNHPKPIAPTKKGTNATRQSTHARCRKQREPPRWQSLRLAALGPAADSLRVRVGRIDGLLAGLVEGSWLRLQCACFKLRRELLARRIATSCAVGRVGAFEDVRRWRWSSVDVVGEGEQLLAVRARRAAPRSFVVLAVEGGAGSRITDGLLLALLPGARFVRTVAGDGGGGPRDGLLLQLRRLQQLGRIKKDAVAIFVFDQGWGLDMDDWYELARLGWASWNVTFNHVDEKALCHKKVKKKYICSRVTDGTYYVAEVPISRVPNHCPTEDEASKRWRSRCGTKHVATLSRL